MNPLPLQQLSSPRARYLTFTGEDLYRCVHTSQAVPEVHMLHTKRYCSSKTVCVWGGADKIINYGVQI